MAYFRAVTVFATMVGRVLCVIFRRICAKPAVKTLDMVPAIARDFANVIVDGREQLATRFSF